MNISDMQYKLARIIDADRGANKQSKIYDRFMCVMIILSIVPLMFVSSNIILNAISWITVGVFFIDFILRCYTSPVDKFKLGRPWWHHYPFTFMGIIDLLSIVPVIYLINPSLSAFKFFRLARLASILKFSRYSFADDMLLKVVRRNIIILKNVSVFVGLYILISAILIYNIEPFNNPITRQPNFSSFFDAIYWSVVTLTTVGYGDIYPTTFIGKLVSVSLMICGIGLIAMISSIITTGLIEEIKSKTKKI